MGDMKTFHAHQEIVCQQALVDNMSIFSTQWSDFPEAITTGLSPEIMLNRYLVYVRQCTLSIIRPQLSSTGLELRFFNTGWSLINFLPPETDCDSVTLHICGGFLVQPRQSDRGEFRFGLEQVSGGLRLSLRLSEFYPLILGNPPPSPIRFWLYRRTQAAVHRLVTIRFLTMLYKEMSGSSVPARVVNLPTCNGQPL
jgi:hypothetical protein